MAHKSMRRKTQLSDAEIDELVSPTPAPGTPEIISVGSRGTILKMDGGVEVSVDTTIIKGIEQWQHYRDTGEWRSIVHGKGRPKESGKKRLSLAVHFWLLRRLGVPEARALKSVEACWRVNEETVRAAKRGFRQAADLDISARIAQGTDLRAQLQRQKAYAAEHRLVDRYFSTP